MLQLHFNVCIFVLVLFFYSAVKCILLIVECICNYAIDSERVFIFQCPFTTTRSRFSADEQQIVETKKFFNYIEDCFQADIVMYRCINWRHQSASISLCVCILFKSFKSSSRRRYSKETAVTWMSLEHTLEILKKYRHVHKTPCLYIKFKGDL